MASIEIAMEYSTIDAGAAAASNNGKTKVVVNPNIKILTSEVNELASSSTTAKKNQPGSQHQALTKGKKAAQEAQKILPTSFQKQ